MSKLGIEYCQSVEKRFLDLVIASGAIAASSPLWAIVYLINRRRGESIIFQQERLGLNGQPFPMYKFETMYAGAENTPLQVASYHRKSHERENGETRTHGRLMKHLRRTGLNELPQTLNVLRGEMSIVGPRPLPKDYLVEATHYFPAEVKAWENVALSILPGLLGVCPQSRGIPVEMFPTILAANENYVLKANFWLDLSIISGLLTIRQTNYEHTPSRYQKDL